MKPAGKVLGRIILCSVLLFLLAPGLVPAQAPPPDVVQALAANVQALKNYCWKTRTMLVQKGETTSVKLEQVCFDESGKLQKTLLGDPPKKKRRGPFLWLTKAAEKEKREQLIHRLSETTMACLLPYPKEIQDFMLRADISDQTGQGADLLRVQGKGFIEPEDYVEIYLDAEKKLPHKMEVDAVSGGDPVQIVFENRPLPDGPTHMERVVADCPKRKVRLVIESFDYVRQL